MQCSKVHETLVITICAILIYIENTEHWSLVMKLTDTIG
jgi:hypothetical protein